MSGTAPETGMIRRQEAAGAMTWQDQKEYAQAMCKSGVFKDVGSAERAIVKMEVAKSLGLHPVDGLRGIHVFDGKLELGVGIICSLIKKSGRYDYHVLQHDENGCAIKFTHVLPDGTQKPIGWQLGADAPKDSGVSVWTKEDTKRAGLEKKDNHAKYPKAMNFARALTQGARLFCPDVFGGSVYAEGEIGDAEPGEVAGREPVLATQLPPEGHVFLSSSPTPTPVDDAVDVPFEPAAADPTPAPPKTVDQLSKEELADRTKALIGQLNLTRDQAVRMFQRRNPDAQKLADLTEEQLREICLKLADLAMKQSMEAALP